MVADGAGGAFLAWCDYRPGPDERDIYASRITGTGAVAPGWPADGLPVCTAPIMQLGPTMTADGSGGVIVAWDDFREGATLNTVDIYAQRITASGTIAAGWPVNGAGVIAGDAERQVQNRVVSDGAGGAIVLWQDTRDDEEGDLYAKRILASGALDPAWPASGFPLCVQPAWQFPTSVIPDGAGGAFVAWDDTRSGIDGDAYLGRLTGSGSLAAGWPAHGVLISNRPGWQTGPLLSRDASGGVYVVWSWGDCCGSEIRALRFGGDGVRAPGWPEDGFPVLVAHPGAAAQPVRMSGDEMGGAVVTWAENRTGFFYDIFAARLYSEGPVPVQVALAGTETAPGLARIRWFARDGVTSATVYRRDAGSDWQARGTIMPDGSGLLVWEDREVISGARYGYRLGVIGESGEEFFAEAWVTIPGAPGLALAGFTPNPSPGVASVAFTLTNSTPARLEVFDLAGRCLATHDVGAMGMGSHTIELGARLPAGVYLLRLTQNGAAVTARGVARR
jgi:hypothetical protein